MTSASASGVRRCRPLNARIPRFQLSIVFEPKRGTPASASDSDGRLQIGKRRDAEVGEEHAGGFGSDAAHRQHFEDRRGKSLVELVQMIRRAGS